MDSTVVRVIRIILLVVVIILFIWFIIWLFTPKNHDTSSNTEETQQTTQPTEQYSNVRYIQDGEITAPENHYSVAITVSAASSHIDVYKGYDTAPVRSESFTNNLVSYDAFYNALVNVGYFNTKQDKTDMRRESACPLGIRYSYQAGEDIGSPTLNSWSASCNGRAGDFAGKKSDVKTLFKKQIPDYSKYVEDINL